MKIERASPVAPTDPGPKFSLGTLYPSGVPRETGQVGYIDNDLDLDLLRDLFQGLGSCSCGGWQVYNL